MSVEDKNTVVTVKNLWYKYSLKQDFVNFVIFVKSNTGLVLANIFFILLTYGIKLFQYSISIDTEVIIYSQDALLQSWLSIGRWGLVLLKIIFGTVNFTPYVATFLMLNTLFVLNMFLCFCFQYFYLGDRQDNVKWGKIGLIGFCAIFITFPTLAEQFNFLLQGFEVAVAMLLSVISAFLILKWACSAAIVKKNKLYVFIGLIALTISIASYQSIMFFFVSVMSAFLILLCIRNTRYVENINFFNVAVKCLSVFLLSCFLYFLSNFIVNIFYQKTEYLNGKILWGSYPIGSCFDVIGYYIKHVFLGDSIFFSKWFAVFTIVFLFAIISIEVVYGSKAILCLSAFVLVFCPFMLTLFLGNITDMRAQIMLPFVLAVEFMILYFLNNNNVLKAGMIVFGVYIIFNQSYTVNRLLYTEQMKYEEDLEIANNIAISVGKLGLGEVPNKPVVFLGVHHPKDNKVSLRGEVLGHSFWEWDGDTIGRKMGFMKVLGYSYYMPSDEQIVYAKTLSASVPAYPAEGCVADLGEVVVVKLSD